MVCVPRVMSVALVACVSACAKPPAAAPDAASTTDRAGLQRVFDGAVMLADVPTVGLPVLLAMSPRDLRPFGRWPDAAFALANHESESGWLVAALYRFDPGSRRWVALGFGGDDRARIDVWRISPPRWVLIRTGHGIGANVRIQVALVGTDLPELQTAELPCRSETSSPVEPAPGDGSWSFRCGSPDDGVSEMRLDFAAGSVTPRRAAAP